MIVCSCSMITSQDVADAVTSLRTADPLVVLTPGAHLPPSRQAAVLRQLPAAHHQTDGRL